jgi:hypothetical protein
MKRDFQSVSSDRFKGNLRHYHRSDTRAKRTWDDWIEGTPTIARPSRNWLKLLGIAFGVLALGGIIVGLMIELS